MIKPLFNNCLVELLDDYEGLVGSSDENVQKGVLRDYMLNIDHLTASTGYELGSLATYKELLDSYQGKVVYWQEYADAGSKFMIDGKQFALVPFYRLIGVDDEQTKVVK